VAEKAASVAAAVVATSTDPAAGHFRRGPVDHELGRAGAFLQLHQVL
jgi:hypothetical protein